MTFSLDDGQRVEALDGHQMSEVEGATG